MPALEQAFQNYLKGIEISGEESCVASERSDLIKKYIMNEIKVSRVFWGGSFRRGTCAGPLDGVKLHIVLSPDYFYECQKNSRKLLNFLKKTVAGEYRHVNIGRDGQVVTVKFGSRPDLYLIPSVRLSSGNYHVPNGIGGWYKTNPARQEELFNSKEELSSGRFRNLVKLIKAWNAHIRRPFNSYFLELLVYYRVNDFTGSYAEMVHSLFWSKQIFLPEFLSCPAVKEPVSLGQLDVVREKIESAYNTSDQALKEEDQEKAVMMWKSLLGDNFGA